MKYFGTIDKNVAAIFQLQWKIWNISDMFLQYSVPCGICIKFQLDTSSHLWITVVWIVENIQQNVNKYTHIHPHIQTFNKFLTVSKYFIAKKNPNTHKI